MEALLYGASDLDVGQALADRAAPVAMSFFESADLIAETKADLSPVTEADRAVERLLREGLAELRPGDAVVGEEFGSTGSSPRTWILDPIDGTNFFAAGSPEWRIQIALEEQGEVTVAVVDMPAVGVRWWATRGGGTFERSPDGSVRRLAVSRVSTVSGAVVTCFPEPIAERLPVDAELRSWRRLSLPEVIRGEIEAFYVDCCQVWDHAPWVLLVEEAGGRFTDHHGGRSPAKRGGLYSNAVIHDELLCAITARRGSGHEGVAVESAADRYTIRPATNGDIDFLTDVVIAATRAQGRLRPELGESAWRADYRRWTEDQVNGAWPGSTMSVVELDGQRVGRLRVVRSADTIELAGVQLLPEAQGRGLGTAIIEALKAEATEAGAVVELGVEKDNPDAHRLYRRLGFVGVGETADEYRLRWSA